MLIPVIVIADCASSLILLLHFCGLYVLNNIHVAVYYIISIVMWLSQNCVKNFISANLLIILLLLKLVINIKIKLISSLLIVSFEQFTNTKKIQEHRKQVSIWTGINKNIFLQFQKKPLN